jgi:hypothetical protein
LLRGRLRASHSEEVHIGGIGSVVEGVLVIEEIDWWWVESCVMTAFGASSWILGKFPLIAD